MNKPGGRTIGTAFVFACFGVAAGAVGADGPVGPDRNALGDAADPLGEAVKTIVYLDQGWSPSDSQRFYFTSQGAQILPYAWFLALEQPDSDKPFRDPANILRFRYLPQKPDAMNPDGLPVGFVRDDGRDRAWLGFTCAACHTTQIDYNGVGYRIDGGPGLGDVQGFLQSLTAALQATRDKDDKLGRFAAKVLGANNNPTGRDDLKAQLKIVIDRRKGYNLRNFPPDRPAGYGRVDAFGAILNEVFHHAAKNAPPEPDATNTKPADASVSYPCLWDTPQHDRVQWVGNAQNGGLLDVLSLGRNVGEVLGVFADFEIPDHPDLTGYRSSVRVRNLRAIEEWLWTLWSPQWPSAFPPIDRAKAAQGKALYDKQCLHCHQGIVRDSPNRSVVAVMAAANTDPRTADNFWNRTGKSGKLEGTFLKVFPSFAGRFGPDTTGEAILSNAVIGTIIGSAFPAPRDELTRVEFGNRPAGAVAQAVALPGALYKARPLNGIWATAPYLHNGSVPSLYQLLLPPAQRAKTFSVGARTFDPVNVGFKADAAGFFQYRTQDDRGQPIPGNSNAGHDYGTDLTDDQRRQIVEYLKTL
jgi:hypothetical protein